MTCTALSALSRREALKSLALALSALTSGAVLAAEGTISDPQWTTLDIATNRYLTLPVAVNGKMMRGIIDSGTTQSIIRQDIALDMGLPYLGAAWAETFTQQLSGSLYQLDQLAVSGVELHDIAIGTFDTSVLSDSIHQNLPVILGQDVLKTIDIEADFVGGRIRGLSPHMSAAWRDHITLPLHGAGKSFPSIRLVLEGRHHDDAIADFGSDVPMMISAEFAHDAGLLKDRRTSTAVTIGAEGPTVTEIFCLDSVRFGPFTLRGLPVQVIDDWRMALPIYVGWSFFHAFDTVLSLGHQIIRLKANEAALTANFPKDRSGLATQRESDRIRVIHVARNSPAWAAGLRDNDVITSIDGTTVSTRYPAPGRRMGIQPAGTPMTVGLTDGRQIAFALADYF